MSGHNKWSKVKHKKAASDAKKSKEFSKLVRLIKAEARASQGNVESPSLKTAIEKAKAANMPKDNIDRAVASASADNGAVLEAVMYEAYGPGGVAMIIEALTDNRNRASAELKHVFSKRGLAIAAPGAAAWSFTRTDTGWVPNQTVSLHEEGVVELQALVDELEDHDDVQAVYTNAE
jgi:YebC/PmpR family DNA-binding regulatory protein